ncbi:WXG100 family type VII secretion target [Mycobacterium sp. URHD0025]|uniref:WXG100 family type VII secretion target n=1 Tax=Mycobacterium sp. URHD0025 TaxID=1298864 RepID=UPI000404B94F|nr:WXG100 family type VII secretion target [Mycobacterium sp. URHD0025]
MSDGIGYNFAGIAADAADLGAASSQMNSLLDEGKGSMTTLQSMWDGSGQASWLALQTRWDANAAELNAALTDLGRAIEEAGAQMASTEASVTSRFG